MLKLYWKISSQVFGAKHALPLDHRILNVSSFYAGVISALFIFVDFALGIGGTAMILAGASLTFFLIYYLSRFFAGFRNRYQLLALPMLIISTMVLVFLWFKNAGADGVAQYFFFLLATMLAVLVRGVLKVLAFALMIGIVVVLIYLDFHGPLQVVDYASEDQRFWDLVVGLPLALVFFSLVLASVTRNYDESYRKVENLRLLMSEDLTLAQHLQNRVYRIDDDMVSEFDISLRHLPAAELSGDLYDLSRPFPDRLRIFLADARGHGINASLSAMLIKGAWAGVNAEKRSPAATLREFNRVLVRDYGDSISFSAVVVDVYADHIIFCSAGHLAQLLCRGSDPVQELTSAGPPIGLVDDPQYIEASYAFETGARLLLFTDALVEEQNVDGKAVGTHWVAESACDNHASSKELGDAVLQRFATLIGQHSHDLNIADDLTLIVLGQK